MSARQPREKSATLSNQEFQARHVEAPGGSLTAGAERPFIAP
jgi:hypothetical protein